jgi:hypothetical protein
MREHRNTKRKKRKIGAGNAVKSAQRPSRIHVASFSKCHPRHRRDTLKKMVRGGNDAKSARRCLPSSFYKQLASQTSADPTQASVKCDADDEHCILDHALIGMDQKMRLRKEYLRPRMPKEWESDPDMWLDNFNINGVMKQYEEAYPWFKYIGDLPIDFSAPNPYRKDRVQCLKQEVCSLDLRREFGAGVRSIGMIFNLDPHYKSGSHWVALYIDIHDIEHPRVMYYDSYGMRVPPMIARFMRSLKLQAPNIYLMYNGRRSQYSNTECGMFSLYFIINMILGVPFEAFVKKRIPDADMLALRKILFTQ